MSNDHFNDVLAEAEAELSVPESLEGMPTVQQFAELENIRRNLDEALSQVKARIESLRPRAESVMTEAGMDRVRMKGLTIFFTEKFSVNKKAAKDGITTEDVCEALRLLGRRDMVADNYSSASLKAYVGELLEEHDEVPEPLGKLLNVRRWSQLTTRK